MIPLFAATTCLLMGASLVLVAAPDPELEALAVLASGAPGAAKEAACLELKRCGTARAVAPLTALVRDPALAQWAIDALGTLPGGEAAAALRNALGEVEAPTRASILHALGQRGESASVVEVARFLTETNALVAGAAALALGQLGGDEAMEGLRRAMPRMAPAVRAVAMDATLAVADRWREAGQIEKARAVYAGYRGKDQPIAVRAAGFRGLARCAGTAAADMVVGALEGSDPLEQMLAVALVRELPDSRIAGQAAASLGGMSAQVQAAVLEALAQRGDAGAAGAAAQALSHSEAAVRLAALNALGELGDASQVPVLAGRAANGRPAEREAARKALTNLRRGEVFPALLAELSRARPEVQAELVPVIAGRGDPGAGARLLEVGATGDEALRPVALRALERLAGDAEAPGLLRLITEASNDVLRAAAQSAFTAAGLRSKHPERFTELGLKAAEGAWVPTRRALLEAAGQMGGPGVLEALRAGVRDASPELANAALRTMAEYGTVEALPDLLVLAKTAPVEVSRLLAIRGYWRLVETLADRPAAAQVAAIRDGLQASSAPASIQAGLARLGRVVVPEALALARLFLREAAVRHEAELACLQIATRLPLAHRADGEAMVRTLAQSAGSNEVRTQAQAMLAQAREHADYLAPWVVSGPYRQAGKEAAQLFDVVFAPETSPTTAEWKPLPVTGTWAEAWTADLAPVVGGDHCVVYLRTRVFVPSAVDVALDLGSDDGIKVWLNGEVVHANNAVRGFTAGADHAKARLREGGNDVFVKITQHTLGCAAAIRVRRADGQPIPGLRVEVGH